jgi:hypothetical protein
MPESHGATAAVSPWVNTWRENLYRQHIRSISRFDESQEKWPRRWSLLFAVVASLVLWALILSPVFFFL